MAYINADKTAQIREAIKKEFPSSKGWKFSISNENHSTVNCHIMEAPVNFEERQINDKWINDHYKDKPEQLEALSRLRDILNGATLEEGARNFDNSDPMTDYFHVGWYIHIQVGKWDKPFKYVEPNPETPKPERAEAVTGKVQVIAYSEKSIAVIGDTYPIKDKLRELGGKFNKFLTCGAGWVFPMNKLEDLKTALS